MRISSYLGEVRLSVESAINLIWQGNERLQSLQEEVKDLTQATEQDYKRVEDILRIDPDDEDGIATGLHWETYFGVDKERFYKSKELDEVHAQIETRIFSMNVEAAKLLQIAKQGMSISKGKLDACADGRLIGTQPLKLVIWQARNQAMHWEEGKLNPPVNDCFNKLANECASSFSHFNKKSLAFEIIKLLEWTSANRFEEDMRAIAT